MNLFILLFIFAGIVQSSSPFHNYDVGSDGDGDGDCTDALKDDLFKVSSRDSNVLASKEVIECPICLEDLDAFAVHKTVCGHIFHFECMQIWRSKSNSCPMCNIDLSYTIIDAINDKSKRRIHTLLKQSYLKGSDGQSLINVCLERRFTFGAQLLIRSGCPSSEPSGSSNTTPLQLASFYNDIGIVLMLLEVNSTSQHINSVDSVTNQTALHLAALKGNLKVVQKLIRSGANYMIRDRNNQLAIDLAIYNGHTECVKYLESCSGLYCIFLTFFLLFSYS